MDMRGVLNRVPLLLAALLAMIGLGGCTGRDVDAYAVDFQSRDEPSHSLAAICQTLTTAEAKRLPGSLPALIEGSITVTPVNRLISGISLLTYHADPSYEQELSLVLLVPPGKDPQSASHDILSNRVMAEIWLLGTVNSFPSSNFLCLVRFIDSKNLEVIAIQECIISRFEMNELKKFNIFVPNIRGNREMIMDLRSVAHLNQSIWKTNQATEEIVKTGALPKDIQEILTRGK